MLLNARRRFTGDAVGSDESDEEDEDSEDEDLEDETDVPASGVGGICSPRLLVVLVQVEEEEEAGPLSRVPEKHPFQKNKVMIPLHNLQYVHGKRRVDRPKLCKAPC